MANYYFLGTILPELSISQPPEITSREFEQLLKENLSNHDFAKIKSIRNYYDIINLGAYWKKEPLDPLGNLDEGGIEEAMVTRTFFPPYVFEFLDRYETDEKRLQHLSELLAKFCQEEVGQEKYEGFLHYYFKLERDRRLILLALRARKLGRDLFKELQYEDPDDELVAQILAQKDSPHYVVPEGDEELAQLFNKYSDEPLQLQKGLIEYRIRKIDEYLGLDLFSMDRILGYMVKLTLLEKWHKLDQQKGKEMVDDMLKTPQ